MSQSANPDAHEEILHTPLVQVDIAFVKEQSELVQQLVEGIQVDPQSFSPGGQEQTPLRQTFGQTVPQLPHLRVLFEVTVSHPVMERASQFPKPGRQEPREHAPVTQVETALGREQSVAAQQLVEGIQVDPHTF